MEKTIEIKKEKEDTIVLATLSTGLALKRTKPHRVHQRYLDGYVKDVLNYLIRTIEQAGDVNETALVANIQDHMTSRQYVVKMNGQNVSPDSSFGRLVEEHTEVEDAAESGEESMKYREVNFIITKVEEGGY